MSKELDDKIDAIRSRLIVTASQQIGMGNYKEKIRAYQEMFLGLINALDDMNKMIEKEIAKPDEGEK